MPREEEEVNRREFLATATKAGAGLLSAAAAAASPRQSSASSSGKATGAWPQEYSAQRDDVAGKLVLSTPYYSVLHDLRRGGAISRIHYTHGAAGNLLIEPIETSIKLAATKLPYHVTDRKLMPPAKVLSDLQDSAPVVSVGQPGTSCVVTVEATLRTAGGQDVGVRTRTTYTYRWGYIKIHKEFVFPERPVPTADLTLLSAVFNPTLTHYGHRPGVFENTTVNPFLVEKAQWGEIRSGAQFDVAFGSRYIPRYIVLANPGIEGIEWFVADDLSQWDFQMTGQPGTGEARIDPHLEPLGIAVSISPLKLPTSPDLARGGFLSAAGSYSFDYYIGMPILVGHAQRRWLEKSFGPNRGQWVPDEEICGNAEDGIVTMTLHNDADAHGDGLFWRDGAYPPYPPEQMRRMRHVLDTCHAHSIKTLPYFSNHELHQSTEAFQKHGEEWGRKPDDQGNLSPTYYYGSHMCLKSGWLDYFKSYVNTVLEHEPFDGIYYDWNAATYCNNPLHMDKTSNGVSGAKELATYAYSRTGHWDVDEILELMEWTRERVGPDGLVALHNTGMPMFATENFADYVCTMEWGYGKLLAGMPKPDQLPLEWALAGARSRADIEYGSIDVKAPARIHRLFYLTALMTGTAPWPANHESAELFKILRPLGDIEQYQFEDWRNRAIRIEGDDFLSAVYSRPGEAFVLLANLQPEPREVRCLIDPRALRHPMSSVRSATAIDSGNSISLDGQRLTKNGERILLPADGVRLIRLRA